MLTGLNLGNFKAFSETQRIPIKPLTLIFGPNSAGKSSILHALLLAHEASREGNRQGLDISRTELGGDSVDLGGFGQYVFRRDKERTVEWAAEFATESMEGRLAEILAPVTRIEVSLGIGLEQVETKPGRLETSSTPYVQRYELIADGASVLRAAGRQSSSLRINHLDYEHPLFKELLKAVILTGTTTESIDPEDYEALREAIDSLLTELSVKRGRFLPLGIESRDRSNWSEDTLFPISRGSRGEDLAEAIRYWLPSTLDELLKGLNETVRSQLGRLHYLGPLRSYPPRHLLHAQDYDPNWFAGGGYAWDEVRKNPELRERVNAWLGAADRLQTPYKLEVKNLIAQEALEDTDLDGPIHAALEQMEEDGLDIKPDYDDSPEPSGAYPTIRDFDREKERIQENIMEHIRARDWDRLQELVLVDCRTDCVVTHRDVGIGISQVLPVLVSAYGSRDSIVAIEQPEIHIHPGLQAELGDVFIETALAGGRNTYLIETHSEHLILRILRRIREAGESELPEGFPDIGPSDVQVLYAKPDRKGVTLHALAVTEDGDFEENWPDGFFTEREEDLF